MVGTGSHAMTSALAPILAESTGMRVRVIPVSVEAERFQRFGEGEFLLESHSISEMEMAVSGMGGYAGVDRYPARILWHQNDTPWMFAAPGNTFLKDVYDIKNYPGIKIANNASSPAMTATVRGGFLDFLELTEEDVTIVDFGSYSDNVRSISEGKAEVSLISPMSSVTHEIAASPTGVKWLDLPLTDTAAWARLLPYRPTAIPAEITWGVESAVGHFGYTSNYLYWASAAVDPDFLYHMARWIYDNHDLYKDAHAALTRMHIDTFRAFLNYCPGPIHESTVKVLKEIGKWTAEDDKWNAEAVALMDCFSAAWEAAKTEAKSKGVRIDASDQEWVDIWTSHKDKAGCQRMATRTQ